MIDLTIITGSGDGETGIGDYTDSLVSNMNMVDKEILRLPESNLQGYYYFTIAVQAVREDRDVIHVQHEYGLFGPLSLMTLVFFPFLYVGARIKRIPVVITVHESLNSRLTAQPLPRLKGSYIFLLNKCLVSCSDHLIFLSENAQQEFAESVTVPSSTVIPHGVDLNNTVDYDRSTARRLLDINVEGPVIIEPGYISRRKGCHLIVELAKQLPDYNFILAGGPEDDSQRDYFDNLEETAPPNLTLTGRLDNQAFHASFAAADIIVLPYIPVIHKGIINTVNQSGIFNWCAAYGVPTVGSDCTYFKRLEEQWECVETADVKDVVLLAQTVDELVSNIERRKKLSQRISYYAQENSLDRIARRHTTIYKNVLNERIYS